MKTSSTSKNIYFKSLTPFEILNMSRQYKCSFEKNEYSDYLDYWKKIISTDGSNEIFSKYCAANNLDDETVSLMISNISYVEEMIHFPEWIFVLENVLEELNKKPQVYYTRNSQKAFSHFFLPFTDYFIEKVIENLTTSNIQLPDKLVLTQLKNALYDDFYTIAHAVLFHEFDKVKKENKTTDVVEDFYYKKFVTDHLSDQFQKLFFKYPMLARKLSKKTSDYIHFITNIFRRFEVDKSDLEILLNIKFGKIVKLHLSSADQHNGESTVIIEFENAFKIVYKPTNLGITNSYNHFLNWINEKLQQKLKTFKILDRQNYGWLEFIESSQCDTIEDIKLYYERAGILLGVTYFLNAKDFHCENIIASGNSPVLIDHETILSPALGKLNEEISELENNLSRTIFDASLLPTKYLDLPYYMYGFGSSGLLESDFPVLKIINANKDSMTVVTEIEKKKLYKLNKPFFNDSVENLISYEKEFTTGFENLYNLILDNKKELQSQDSPITNFYTAEIRFINRHTKVYSKILQFISKPEYFSDPIKYGLKLEILSRAYKVVDYCSPILDFEREQLLKDDIPAFYIGALDKSIHFPNKKELNLIKRNAIENIYDKLENASLEDLHNQKVLIADSIAL